MSENILKRLETYRKDNGHSILEICRQLDIHNATYHRWRNTGKITVSYQKIVEQYLRKRESNQVNPENAFIEHLCSNITNQMNNKMGCIINTLYDPLETLTEFDFKKMPTEELHGVIENVISRIRKSINIAENTEPITNRIKNLQQTIIQNEQ